VPDDPRPDRSAADLSVFFAFLERSEGRLATQLDGLGDKIDERVEALDRRVDDLERWHLLEQERAGARLAQRAAQLARWQMVSIAAGVLAAIVSAAQWLI
jgi:hypothetical protein